jgi:hypothetical protein
MSVTDESVTVGTGLVCRPSVRKLPHNELRSRAPPRALPRALPRLRLSPATSTTAVTARTPLTQCSPTLFLLSVLHDDICLLHAPGFSPALFNAE